MIKCILGLTDSGKFRTVKKYLEAKGAVNIKQDIIVRTLVYFDSDILNHEHEFIKGVVPAEQEITINVKNIEWGIEKPDILLKTNKHWQPGLEAIGVDHSHEFTGRDVDVYVVDTGVAPHTTLPEIRRLKHFPWKDDNGHGTHVAGSICSCKFGIAYDVNLYSLKVLNAQGKGALQQVVDAIIAIIEHRRAKTYKNPAVVNMSFLAAITGFNPVMEACSVLINEGAIVVMAAGNQGRHLTDISEDIPKESLNIITVASTNNEFQLSKFSNYGHGIKINAPGESVISCWLDDGVASMSGTSMAAPRVTGVLAALLEARGTEMKSINDVALEVEYFLNHATEVRDSLSEISDHTLKFLDIGTVLNDPETEQKRLLNEHDEVMTQIQKVMPWIMLTVTGSFLITLMSYILITAI